MKQTNRVEIDFSSRAALKECLDRGMRILLQNSNTLAGLDQKQFAQHKIRLALLKLGSVIRRTWKESLNEGTRVEFRTLLDDMKRLSTRLSHSLSDERLVKALQLPVLREEIRHKLHKFLSARSKLINELQSLSSSIPNVVDALQLSGNRGHAGPFYTVQVPPKVLVGIYGRKLFTELGVTKRPPSARHGMFVDFLDCVWTLATNSSEAENDWSTPIKIAALQRETGSGAGAHLLARLEAGDFARELLRDLGIGQRGALIAPNPSR
jgi:hypothetical protein